MVPVNDVQVQLKKQAAVLENRQISVPPYLGRSKYCSADHDNINLVEYEPPNRIDCLGLELVKF